MQVNILLFARKKQGMRGGHLIFNFINMVITLYFGMS